MNKNDTKADSFAADKGSEDLSERRDLLFTRLYDPCNRL
jgi:hypothetical protein